VSVAFAEEAHQAHQADDQLVAVELFGARGELVDLPPEVLARDGVIRVGMDPLELVGEEADVARGSRHRRLRRARATADDDRREQDQHQPAAAPTSHG
jgi:hypothetical protein